MEKSPEDLKKEERERANREFIKDHLGELYKFLVEMEEDPNIERPNNEQRLKILTAQKLLKEGRSLTPEQESLLSGESFKNFEKYQNNIYRRNNLGNIVISPTLVIDRLGGFGDNREFKDRAKKLQEDVSKVDMAVFESWQEDKQKGIIRENPMTKNVTEAKLLARDMLKAIANSLSKEEKQQFIAEISKKHYEDPEKSKKQQDLIEQLRAD